MRLCQQGMTVGKRELLTAQLKHCHVTDTAAQGEVLAVKVGHVEEGVLGILAIAIHIVAVLQQFGVWHALHVRVLIRCRDGRILLS